VDDRMWTERALCRGKTELFFGTPRERPGRRARREALAVAYCQVCPVVDQCRSAGRAGREFGMWGGETEEDRARLGYPPPAMMRRSVVAAARQGREYLGDTEPTAADLAEAELLEAEILADAAEDPLLLHTLDRRATLSPAS
jgi:WhiB family transcriptional regulator, redox-sensing transcriptional regulator